MAATTLNILSCHNRIPFSFLIRLRDLFISAFTQFLMFISSVFVPEPFSWNLTIIYTYFYVICWYYHVHKDGGVLYILIRIPYIHYAIFHQENLKWDSLNSFLPKVSRYFCTLLISNCKFEITTVPQIDLKYNLILFILTCNINYSLS